MISNYDVGAFEALEWAWNLLRNQRSIDNIDDAVNKIQEMLYTLGNGNPIDFRKRINDL
jgi:hypothetical protein